MATFAIGDIHGCLTALTNLVDYVQPGPDDTLIFLGDYVDRGPDSQGVIDYMLNLSSQHKLITLRGNHEIMMMDSREDDEKLFMWLNFGGEETLDSYAVSDGTVWQNCVPDRHWDFLEHTERYYETDTHIFVHAGLTTGLSLDKQPDSALFWKKYRNPSQFVANKTVICGHTAQEHGAIGDFAHTVCIDTYAYGGQWLTCLNVDTGQYWQASQGGALQNDVLSQ